MKDKLLFLTIITLMIGLFSCAPRSIAETEVKVMEKPGVQIVKASWEVEWENLIKTANKEGQVVVYAGAVPPEVNEWMSKAFKLEFGTELVITSGPPTMQVEKLFRERKAGLFLADVWIGGPTNNLLELKPGGVTKRLDDVLFLPSVIDPKLWGAGGDGPFFDADHHIAIGMNSVQPMLAKNPQLVKPGEINSLKDLLDPKWKGRIAMGDPTQGGSKTALIWVYKLMGEEFMSKLALQQPTIIRDKRQLVEWVARGKAHLALGVTQDQVGAFQKVGAAVEYNPVEEGMLITFGASSISLLEQAPHPKGARLLVNWLLTKDVQAEWGPRHDLASRRQDVTNDWIEPLRRIQPGAKYHTTDENFYLTQEKDVRVIISILKSLM